MRPAIDTRFWISLGSIVAVAVAAACADGQQQRSQVAWLDTAMNFYSVLAYGATGVLLLATLRADARRAIVILAATSLASLLLGALTVVTRPLSEVTPAIAPSDPQTSTWAYFFLYLVASIGALEYAGSRNATSGDPPSRRWVATVAGGALLLAGVLGAVAFIAPARLPLVPTSAAFTTLRGTGLAYVQIVLALVALTALVRMRKRDGIDRAVLLSTIALTCLHIVLLFAGHRYTLSYLFMRVLNASAATFVLIATLDRFVRAFYRLPDMMATLVRTERIAVRQSDRLAVVWRLVNDAGLTDEERIQAILDAGAVALRPGVEFFGTLRRVDGDELVIEIASGAFDSGTEGFGRGSRIELEAVFGADILAAGKTIAVNDYGCNDDGTPHSKRPRSTQWNSIIGTPFTIAGTWYILAFAARTALTNEPFTDDDLAFVDVLASFIANRLQQGRQTAQIRYQIEHDLLTGLPTRSNFRAAATKIIAEGIPCAIAVIDLDRFRDVNETFGHMIGDAMLVEISAGLNAARGSGDLVARLGGDNFGVLIANVASPSDVETRLAPYREIFSHPLVTGDRTGREALFLNASIGVALYPQDAQTFSDVLAGADSAVDDVKARQRGAVAFYNQAFEASVQRRRTLRLELAGAIDNGQFMLFYQPLIELATGSVVGVEALLRWEHPELGAVSPAEFIPVAESSTLIRPIGKWVFRRAMHDMAALGILPESFKCFINLSGYQLYAPEFMAAMQRYLAEEPKTFHHIAIDINENVAMQDPDRTLDVMAVLREMGMEIALDDFGTGQSALAYVTRFPINIIKIDAGFIDRLPGDAHDSALVEVLLGTAQRFNFLTHAEGVESEAQFAWLRQRGCTYAQGYYIAAPMNFPDLIKWLRTARLATSGPSLAIRPPS